jgi:hypothetical protein
MKDRLNILEKIETVEAPAFLFTRIQAKIEERLAGRVSKKQAIACLAGICLIIALNILALSSGKTGREGADLVSEMNLSPSNQLY